MRRLMATIAVLVLGMLSIGVAPAVAQGECAIDPGWPSFAEVARSARSIYIAKVSKSVDGVAIKARPRDVLRGSAPARIDLRTLETGRATDDCPEPSGPLAPKGAPLVIAFDGIAADGRSVVDAIAYVGREQRAKGARSDLEWLTLKQARAYDGPGAPQPVRPEGTPLPLHGSVDLADLPLATALSTIVDTDEGWSCGGDAPTFPASALAGPLGVEQARGAVFDGLRSALEALRSEFEFDPRGDRPHELPWLLVYEDADQALFLVKRSRGQMRYSAMSVAREGDVWGFGGFSGCELRPPRAHELGPSSWRVAEGTMPTPESTTLSVEVMERACASGQTADGRIADPGVDYSDDSITIIIPVRRVEGFANCQGNPWTPFTVQLDEPIGDRALLDGEPWPPERRWPNP